MFDESAEITPLTTADQLGYARRNSRRVLVYSREDGELDCYGFLIGFDADTITLLHRRLGVVNFLREKVNVYLAPDVPDEVDPEESEPPIN